MLHRFENVIFDLDGTLVDTSEGITKSVAYSLDRHGIPYLSVESLKCFIGPPLKEQFMAFCNKDSDFGTDCVKVYREYYSTRGIYECKAYENVEKLLSDLKNSGFHVYVATSKPEKFAKIVLEHTGLLKYFDDVAGANMDNTRTDKAEVLSYLFDKAGIKDKEKSVMVGDCPHDVVGAKRHGINAIAVSYGFGALKDLEELEPLCICKNPDELFEFLVK